MIKTQFLQTNLHGRIKFVGHNEQWRAAFRLDTAAGTETLKQRQKVSVRCLHRAEQLLDINVFKSILQLVNVRKRLENS